MTNHHIHIEQLSDVELVLQYKSSGDKIFFAELYQRYTHLVLGTCFKYLKNEQESKDAVMDIFEKLLVDLLKHEVVHFKSWLYMVTKNHCLMILRSKNPTTISLDLGQPFRQTIMENPDDLHLPSQQAEDEKKLLEALQQLNTQQKICVELFYLQNKCYQDIANETGYTLNQVKSYIQNGKRNLKIILDHTQPSK